MGRGLEVNTCWGGGGFAGICLIVMELVSRGVLYGVSGRGIEFSRAVIVFSLAVLDNELENCLC